MSENLGDATLYLEIDDTPLDAGLQHTEQLVNQRLQSMAAQVLAQNNLITSSFASALGQTTTSIASAFAGWTATFSSAQSALTTQSNQLYTDFTLSLLTQSTTLTTSLISAGAATDAWIRGSSLALSGWLTTTTAQVLAQNNLITSSFASALGQTTTSITSAFASWTATFSTEQSALATQSNQLYTDFTISLLTQSTTLTTSLISAGAATDAWIRGSSLALNGWLTTTAAGTSSNLTGLFTAFSSWLNSSFSALAASTAATANRIVGTINALASRMNQPIAAWNALQFHVPGFSHTVRVPSFTLPTGETVGGQSKSFGWGGATMQTSNVPSIQHVAPIPTIVGAAVGGLFTNPTLATIADGGEPEAVIPLSRLPQFAGEAAGFTNPGKSDLHLHIENAYGIDNLVDQINEYWLDGRLRGLQDQLAGAG